MKDEALIKSIMSMLKKIAKNEVLKEIQQEAIKNKDFGTLEKIQTIMEGTV